jgi:predicted PurR-regulated permease PerM
MSPLVVFVALLACVVFGGIGGAILATGIFYYTWRAYTSRGQ